MSNIKQSENSHGASNYNKIISIAAVVLIALVIFLAANKFTGVSGNKNPNFYDTFAQCLTDKGAVMYGAAWCTHCKDQKAAFADSFKFINYVECPDNTQLCIDKGVEGFPTWIIGTSTDFVVGFDKNTTMKELSDVSGCILPQ